MGPRKRSKPNPKEAATSEAGAAPYEEGNGNENGPTENSNTEIKNQQEASQTTTTNSGTSTPNSGKSWCGGTWPRERKSLPVTQLAKESITSAGSVASNVVATARASTPPLGSPLRSLARHAASSSRSLPLVSNATKLNTNTNVEDPSRNKSSGDVPIISTDEKAEVPSFQNRSPLADVTGLSGPSEAAPSVGLSGDPPGWFSWFSKSSEPVKSDQSPSNDNENDMTIPATNVKETSPRKDILTNPEEINPIQKPEDRRSWLGFWNSNMKQNEILQDQTAEGAEVDPTEGGLSLGGDSLVAKGAPEDLPQPPMTTAKSYGWAFWSRDVKGGSGTETPDSGFGHLAEAGSPSQSKPEKDKLDKDKGIPNKVAKRGTSDRFESEEPSPVSGIQNQLSLSEVEGGTKQIKTSIIPASKKPKIQVENLLLPSFKGTYRTGGRSGLIQQLGRWLHLGNIAEPKHVDLCSPPRVKSALAIGIHGYFPTPFFRSVLGQPTGTSIRFVNNTAHAIQEWTKKQGYVCDVEKVALEGEGRIAQRVNLLWDLLLNWIDKIRTSDLIIISCHSQGVPVAIELVAKLIAFGCVGGARIGICAMAGVNMGPFPELKSRWIGGSAGELFEFARPSSQVSADYRQALDVALRYGVKIVFSGSIDDQLVSLDSSTFSPLSHPYIYRAVFIDGRVHAPDFLTHLVGFALKLRNLGISDHGLIRELSAPLAGSLYTGDGHSRIYDEEKIYSLAIEYALETTSVGSIPLQITGASIPIGPGPATGSAAGPSTSSSTSQNNPYILPFAMRGLLEEEYVKSELYDEITELIRQFDNWKPSNKALKDVKFRLEGVRSKL